MWLAAGVAAHIYLQSGGIGGVRRRRHQWRQWRARGIISGIGAGASVNVGVWRGAAAAWRRNIGGWRNGHGNGGWRSGVAIMAAKRNLAASAGVAALAAGGVAAREISMAACRVAWRRLISARHLWLGVYRRRSEAAAASGGGGGGGGRLLVSISKEMWRLTRTAGALLMSAA